jgi:hypothetical protein
VQGFLKFAPPVPLQAHHRPVEQTLFLVHLPSPTSSLLALLRMLVRAKWIFFRDSHWRDCCQHPGERPLFRTGRSRSAGHSLCSPSEGNASGTRKWFRGPSCIGMGSFFTSVPLLASSDAPERYHPCEQKQPEFNPGKSRQRFLLREVPAATATVKRISPTSAHTAVI